MLQKMGPLVTTVVWVGVFEPDIGMKPDVTELKLSVNYGTEAEALTF